MHRSTNPDWYYTDDLLLVLGISKPTLKRQLRKGKLPPYFSVGKRHVWRKDTVEMWIADQEAESARQHQRILAEARAETTKIKEQALNRVLSDVIKNAPLSDEARTRIAALTGDDDES